MEQVAILEIKVKSQSLDAALEQARDSVRRLNAEFRKTKEGTDDYKRLSGELANAKNAVKDLTAQQKTLNKEFAALKVPKDSLAGMRLEYSRLSQQIANLSAEERKSSFGKSLISSAKSVKGEIDGIEQSIGRFTGNVGNYKQALAGVGDILTGGLVTGGAIVAMEKLIDVMRIGAKEAIAYEKALDDLSALTGMQGADLQGLEDVGKSLQTITINGVEVVNTGTDILNALKLVGGAQPELLKNADALGQVTKAAIILQQASGDDLATSVNSLTTVLGQFNAEASESERIINELAAGAKVGASEIPQTTDALQKFGTVAKIFNVSTSESVALIELLADNQLKGAEAGTQLRNVLTKLSAADVLPKEAQNQLARLGINLDILKDKTLPFEVRLKELGKAQGDLAALTKIFGLENLQAATIITNGVSKYGELKTAIEGTSEAYTQAAIRSDNASTKLQNLGNKSLNQLSAAFNSSTGIVSGFADSLSFLVDKLNVVELAFATASGPTSQFLKAYDNLKERLGFGPEKIGTRKIETIDGGLFKEQAKQELPKDVQVLADIPKYSAAAKESIAGLKLEVKRLKTELSNSEIGSDRYNIAKDSLEKAQARLKELEGSAGLRKSTSKDDKGAAGSIKELQDQVRKLNQELESAPPDQIERILGDLVKKEKELERVKSYVEFLKGGGFGDRQGLTPLVSIAPEDGLAMAVQELQNELSKLELTAEVKLQFEALDKIKRSASEALSAAQTEKEKFEKRQQQDEEEKNKRRKEELIGAAVDIAGGVNSELANIKNQEINDELDAQIAALDKKTQAEIEAAGTNQAAIDQIKAQSEKKREELEKQAAEKRKQVAIKEALIAGALAVIKALPNPIAAGAAAAATLVQVALMRKQKFEKGGKVALISGPSHAAGGVQGYFSDGTRIEVEGDEELHVLKRNNTSAKQRLSMENIRRGGVPLFERGGYVPLNNIPLSRSYGPSSQTNVTVRLSDADIQKLAVTLAAETAGQTSVAVEGAVINGMQQGTRLNERISDAQKLRRV